MTPQLKSLLLAAGVATASGLSFFLWAPSRGVDRAYLLDAGVADAQRVVVVCEERIGRGLAKRLRRELGAGALRPHQRYAAVARVGFCARPDGASGNCLRPDGGVFAAAARGDILIPSLRKTASASSLEDDEDDDGDESQAIQLDGRCDVRPCNAFGSLCSKAFGVALATPECVIPNCWTSDGGWNDSAVVNCTQRLEDGGHRYGGCNVFRASIADGGRCVPSSCTVISGEHGSLL